MNYAKQLLLQTYYQTTLPQRRAEQRKRCARGAEPVRILFYHRVADTHPNPWTMGRRQFARQIDWIAAHYDVVSLADAQDRMRSGTNNRPTAAITFDDAYAENCEFALPMLLDRQLPFTYFVTTGNVLDQTPFPHDWDRGVPLAPNRPEQIAALAAAGVEVGAHTRTHTDLGKVDSERLVQEIIGSKDDLEKMIDRPVRYFAFPFGQHANMTAAGFRVAREAGFAGVCSAYGGYNFPGDDAFHLQRFHADPEMIRLKNWLTIDPRKLRDITAFEVSDVAIDLAIDLVSTPLVAEGTSR